MDIHEILEVALLNSHFVYDRKYKTDSMFEMFQTMIQPIAGVNLRIYIKTVIDLTPNTRC
jgi:hypothetical protein